MNSQTITAEIGLDDDTLLTIYSSGAIAIENSGRAIFLPSAAGLALRDHIATPQVIPAGTPVYVVQSMEGDIIDVTTSREWAEWQTRDDEDVPERTLIEDTLWDGPIDREDWT